MKHLGWIFVLLLAASPAMAQLELESSTVDGGGGTSSTGNLEVSGTIGQFDAGAVSGGDFDLEGGFWNSQNSAVPVELMSFEIAELRFEEAGAPRVVALACASIRVGEELRGTWPVRRGRDEAAPLSMQPRRAEGLPAPGDRGRADLPGAGPG